MTRFLRFCFSNAIRNNRHWLCSEQHVHSSRFRRASTVPVHNTSEKLEIKTSPLEQVDRNCDPEEIGGKHLIQPDSDQSYGFNNKTSVDTLHHVKVDLIDAENFIASSPERQNFAVAETAQETREEVETKYVQFKNEEFERNDVQQENIHSVDRFQTNELVVVRARGAFDYLLVLEKDRIYNFKPDIKIPTEHIIDQCASEGSLELSGNQMPIRRPTLAEFLRLLKRTTAAATPKVLYGMFHSLGVTDGQKVLESGSGSGIATLILSSLVGSSGQVDTVESQKRNHNAAKKHFTRWATSFGLSSNVPWPNNVEFFKSPIQVFKPNKTYDTVFLDLTDPLAGIDVSSQCLKNGGKLAIYAPSISRISDIDRVIHERRLPFLCESVFEETDVHWNVTDNASSRKLGWVERNEEVTAFLGIFRKISPLIDSDESRTESENVADSNADVFAVDDSAILRFTDGRKSGKTHETIVRLKPGTWYCNDFGKIYAEDVIGKPVGAYLRSPAGYPFYCIRPTLQDWLRLPAGGILSKLQKHVMLSLSLAGVQRGQRVMLAEDRNRTLAAALLQLETVGPSESIVVSKSEDVPKTFSWSDLASGTKAISGDDFSDLFPSPKNVRMVSASSLESAEQCDCAYIRSREPENYIASAARLLKKNKLVSVLCHSITEVNHILEISRKFPFEIVDVHEHCDRPWIVQPIGIIQRTAQIDVQDKPYICRPKQGLDLYTAYIIIMRKV